MHRVAVLLATSMLIASAQAASPGPPKFDINAACRDAAAIHDAATRADTIKLCLESENKARKEVEEKWLRYDPALRAACVSSSAIGGVKPVYSELIICAQPRRMQGQSPRHRGAYARSVTGEVPHNLRFYIF
jgi:hypothetical protein